jgi:hypothetical protein
MPRWWRQLTARIVIDADQLRQIIEENSPSPQIVPGTATTARKRPLAEATEVAAAEPAEDLRRKEEG